MTTEKAIRVVQIAELILKDGVGFENETVRDNFLLDLAELEQALNDSIPKQKIAFGAYQPKEGDRFRDPASGKIRPFGKIDSNVENPDKYKEKEGIQSAKVSNFFQDIVVGANKVFKANIETFETELDNSIHSKIIGAQNALRHASERYSDFIETNMPTKISFKNQLIKAFICIADCFNEIEHQHENKSKEIDN